MNKMNNEMNNKNKKRKMMNVNITVEHSSRKHCGTLFTPTYAFLPCIPDLLSEAGPSKDAEEHLHSSITSLDTAAACFFVLLAGFRVEDLGV